MLGHTPNDMLGHTPNDMLGHTPNDMLGHTPNEHVHTWIQVQRGRDTDGGWVQEEAP